MYAGKKIGVVVPAYNEEEFIESVIRNIPNFIDAIFIVNDASTDSTAKIIKSLKQDRIYCINHNNNRGVGASIVSGYKIAIENNMDIVVVMAGDDQMDAAYLTRLLDPVIEQKADYAKGNRLYNLTYRRGMSNWRFFGNWILTILTKIASGYWKVRDPQNGYTAINRKALESINLDTLYPYYGYCNDLLVKLHIAGCKVIDIPIPSRYGTEKSKIEYSSYIRRVSLLLMRNFLLRLNMEYLK